MNQQSTRAREVRQIKVLELAVLPQNWTQQLTWMRMQFCNWRDLCAHLPPVGMHCTSCLNWNNLLSVGQELLTVGGVLTECKPRPADKFDGLAERKSRVADKSVFADRSRAAGVMELANRSRATGKAKLADGSRAASKVGVAKRKPRPAGNIFWELSVAAIGCSAKDSGSDFLLWHSPQVWVFVESVFLLGSSASCFG